jgi:hypothetical protein
MKNIFKISVGTILVLMIGCKEEVEKPKVIYENSSKVITQKRIDTTELKVSDLPINMEGTKYLIHALGDVRIYDDSRGKSYGSSKTNQVSYAISNYSQYEITGYLQNLKFQHVDSTAMHLLSHKKIQIQTATYLNTIADKSKKQILVYSLVDLDTNRDNKLDQNDIKALYISSINGRNFTKLSADYHELIDWNVIEAQNRLYFRTIEDINKNGAFDKDDMVHYHYVNLLSKDWKVENYDPVE